MSYNAYIAKLTNLRPHPNADRLKLGDCFGNTVCVGLDYTEGMIGVYFPTDGQVSLEFAEVNNLLRKKDEAGNNIGGYMDPNKRNVTAIRLRGEKSDGLFLNLSCLEYTGVNMDDLDVGMPFTTINGHEICQKYIPRSNSPKTTGQGGNRTRKKKVNIAPLFAEHADTEQLAYNLSAFKPGDEIEITLKMHGTSQRTGYLPVFKGYKRTFWDWLFRREGVPMYEYGYVSGTRRVVLENYEGGFYGDNSFREQHSKKFEGKLWKGETVYYEVVGFTDTGAPIMGQCNNKKLNDKEFIKKYGETTTFSYGCKFDGVKFANTITEKVAKELNENIEKKEKILPQSDIYVYRMTMTNPDGEVVEYTPDFMRYRCEMMGVKTVPIMWKDTIPKWTGDIDDSEPLPISAGEWIKEKAEEYYDGPDPIGRTHVREGVVVRILNRPKFTAYKHKNFNFKVLSGIAIETANTDNMDEDLVAEL